MSVNQADRQSALRITIPFLLLVSCGWSLPLQAAPTCFSSPPNVADVEAYRFVPIPEIPLSETELTELEAWFTRVDGVWSGDYSETLCHGSREQPDPQQHVYTLRATGRRDTVDPSLVIDARMDSSENSKPVTFKLYLDEEKRALYYQADSPGNRVQLRRIDDERLGFVRKYVVHTNRGGVVMRETHVTVRIENRSIRIAQNYYTNGILSGYNRWRLH